jgi:hypothetical protein
MGGKKEEKAVRFQISTSKTHRYSRGSKREAKPLSSLWPRAHYPKPRHSKPPKPDFKIFQRRRLATYYMADMGHAQKFEKRAKHQTEIKPHLIFSILTAVACHCGAS